MLQVAKAARAVGDAALGARKLRRQFWNAQDGKVTKPFLSLFFDELGVVLMILAIGHRVLDPLL